MMFAVFIFDENRILQTRFLTMFLGEVVIVARHMGFGNDECAYCTANVPTPIH